ncbi:hypothetical protein RRG08_047442 [Elysia crispata]|uniref:Uncharacterized protein n=1 Tax=Elysia crispata TaxID=231223 RepID=A0AAE0YUY7_9GAST|nr:hypothetical protein RRG08_047442 [Elysia crispata]
MSTREGARSGSIINNAQGPPPLVLISVSLTRVDTIGSEYHERRYPSDVQPRGVTVRRDGFPMNPRQRVAIPWMTLRIHLAPRLGDCYN